MWIDVFHDQVTTKAGRYAPGRWMRVRWSDGAGPKWRFRLDVERVSVRPRPDSWKRIWSLPMASPRTANPCTPPELFWAIKGGTAEAGGREVEYRRFDCSSHGLWNSAPTVCAIRTGANGDIRRDNTLELSMVCQGLESAQATEVWRLFFEWARHLSPFGI